MIDITDAADRVREFRARLRDARIEAGPEDTTLSLGRLEAAGLEQALRLAEDALYLSGCLDRRLIESR